MKRKRSFVPRPARQDNLLSLISIVSVLLLTAAVVALILWGLYRAELFSLPAELHLFFDPAETAAETEKPAPSVYDILRDAGAETDPAIPVYRFSGDFSVLRALLAQSRPRDAWYTETETVLRAGKDESTAVVCFWRLGDSYRIERRTDGKTTELFISDGTRVYYKDMGRNTSRVFTLSDEFSPEAAAGIPSAASFSEVPEEQIEAASYAEIDGSLVYYVRFLHPDSGFREEYWISPESELVIRCRTYSGPIEDENAVTVFSGDIQVSRALSDEEKETMFVIPVR